MKQNKKFHIGIAFTLIGIIFTFIKSFLMILGLFFVIIGIILVLISNLRWIQKLIWAISIFIVVIFFNLLSFYRMGGKAFEKFYFSSKLNGKVRILYSKKCGVVPEIKEDWAIINVDTNHALIVKRDFERIYVKSRFFVVNENNDTLEIPEIKYFSDYKKDISVLNQYTGYYTELKVNIQDFVLLRTVDDFPSDEENALVEQLALEKLRDNCR